MSVLDVLEALDSVPSAVVKPVLVLVNGIVNLVAAGDDPAKRFEALMNTAERLKAEADDAKFGPRKG